jgi:hypothetical protein
VEVGTQGENMRQAVARGRAVGPRPGRVDTRGKVGASRAIQAALRAAVDRSPAALARVLDAVIAEGDPMRDMCPLFDVSDCTAPPEPVTDRRVSRLVGVPAQRVVVVESLPLFDA